jgi:hypothetical protein
LYVLLSIIFLVKFNKEEDMKAILAVAIIQNYLILDNIFEDSSTTRP